MLKLRFRAMAEWPVLYADHTRVELPTLAALVVVQPIAALVWSFQTQVTRCILP